MDTTIYYFQNGKLKESTHSFPVKSERELEIHLTSIYGSDNMENVFWDIWEPPEDEGLEELDFDEDSDVSKYLKRKANRKCHQ